MDSVLRGRIFGLIRLISLNFDHYFFAIWGFGLALDPDYPLEPRFFGNLVTDSILESRGYGLFALWCPFLALALPQAVLLAFGALWTAYAWKRAGYYRRAFLFWRQAFYESPGKDRVRVRYAEQLSLEIERLDKANIPFSDPQIQELITEGMAIQNVITRRKECLSKH